MNVIERLFATVDWEEIPPPNELQRGEVYATHEGVLNIEDFTFRCFQLSNGLRVLDAEDVHRFFGLEPGPYRKRWEGRQSE